MTTKIALRMTQKVISTWTRKIVRTPMMSLFVCIRNEGYRCEVMGILQTLTVPKSVHDVDTNPGPSRTFA